MANDEELARLRQGVDVWNDWRSQNRQGRVANISGMDLSGRDLSGADLHGMDLGGANLQAHIQKLSHIYTQELQPALDNLKKALGDARIRCRTEKPLNIYFLLTDTSNFAGLPIRVNRFTSEEESKDDKSKTVSISSVGVLFNVEKMKMYRQNPYTYLW